MRYHLKTFFVSPHMAPMIFLLIVALFSSFHSFAARNEGSLYDCTQFFHPPEPEGSAEMVAEYLFETTRAYAQKNGINEKVNEVAFNLDPQAKNAKTIDRFLRKVFLDRQVTYLHQLIPPSQQDNQTYDPYTVLTKINELTRILWVITCSGEDRLYGFKGFLNPNAFGEKNQVTTTSGH